jgi:hypothetical protein
MIRKLIIFFSGLVLIALMIAMLFLTSVVYDSAKKSSVETYFFQRNLLSESRTGMPETPDQIGETAMREMLIKKYINEYFYVIPDVEDIANRMGRNSTLAKMSSRNVFNNWLETVATDIQEMANKKKMRIVDIDGEIYRPSDSDYWVVPYVLYTWDTPNDMATPPTALYGTLLMDIAFEMGIRETVGGDTFDVGKYLQDGYNRFESGYEPAVIFKFRVDELEHVSNE